jgi:hypothetical protein
MTRLSTCGTCRGIIEQRPGSVAGWGHVTENARNADGHLPTPDDSAVSGPDRSDLPECTGCHHPEHEEGECEEEVSTGLHGSDGLLVYTFCACTGPAAEEPVHLAFRSTIRGEEGLVCTCGSAHTPDPWTDSDAAARNDPPPF